MTQSNEREAFDKWFDDKFKDLNPSEYQSNSFEIGKSNMRYGWQAATQASESEINSLKQRVEELEATNSCLVRINVSLAKESEELEIALTSLQERKI